MHFIDFLTIFLIFKVIELPLNFKIYCLNFPQSVFSSNGTHLRGETVKYIDFLKITILRATLIAVGDIAVM